MATSDLTNCALSFIQGGKYHSTQDSVLDPRRFQWISGKVIFDGLHMKHCDYVLLPGEGA